MASADLIARIKEAIADFTEVNAIRIGGFLKLVFWSRMDIKGLGLWSLSSDAPDDGEIWSTRKVKSAYSEKT